MKSIDLSWMHLYDSLSRKSFTAAVLLSEASYSAVITLEGEHVVHIREQHSAMRLPLYITEGCVYLACGRLHECKQWMGRGIHKSGCPQGTLQSSDTLRLLRILWVSGNVMVRTLTEIIVCLTCTKHESHSRSLALISSRQWDGAVRRQSKSQREWERVILGSNVPESLKRKHSSLLPIIFEQQTIVCASNMWQKWLTISQTTSLGHSDTQLCLSFQWQHSCPYTPPCRPSCLQYQFWQGWLLPVT